MDNLNNESIAATRAAYGRARKLVDEAHAADPARLPDGTAAELAYADRVEAWVARLVPEVSPLLLLAARCQHLQRWAVPRSTFPLDKPGYLAWRKSLYARQAELARSLMMEAGMEASEADEAALWISKTALKTNAGTQALEDAAVLVFLEHEIADFAARHADYSTEKFVGILRRTWRKLSEDGRSAALALDVAPAIKSLLELALKGDDAA